MVAGLVLRLAGMESMKNLMRNRRWLMFSIVKTVEIALMSVQMAASLSEIIVRNLKLC